MLYSTNFSSTPPGLLSAIVLDGNTSEAANLGLLRVARFDVAPYVEVVLQPEDVLDSRTGKFRKCDGLVGRQIYLHVQVGS